MLLARYLYRVERDIRGAVELASQVIKERPDQAIKAHNLLGVVAMNYGFPGSQTERFQLSARHLQTALAMDADFVPALINHGLLFAKLDQIDDATKSLERAIALDPTNAVAHSTYGTVLMWACRWEDAVAAYESAITFDPSLPAALLGRHRVEAMQRGDYSSIIGAYHELVKLRPQNASKWVGLQEVLAYEDERRRRHEACSGTLTTIVTRKF